MGVVTARNGAVRRRTVCIWGSMVCVGRVCGEYDLNMTDMKKLRVGLVGTGLIGRQHAEAIGRIPGIELVAIAEPNGEVLEKQKRYFGVNGYADYKEMIDREMPDVIHNCTPNVLHYEINKYALERGIHVYSEKPLAVTVGQADELTRLAHDKGLANGVNFNYRNNAAVQEMRVRMAGGDAGRCFLVHGHYLQDWLLHDTDFNWRLMSEEGGRSRALADIGSHWFDTVQVVTGRRVAAVYARNIQAYPVRKRACDGRETEYEVDTEDGGTILFELEDGTPGSVVVSQVSAGYKNSQYFSFDCRRYSMRWNQEQSDRLWIGSREGGLQQVFAAPDAVDASVSRYATLPAGHPVGWADAFTNGFREFYRSLDDGSYRNGKTTYADFADAAYIMRIVDACMRSNAGGRWEKV